MNIALQELAELALKIGTILERHGLKYHLTGGVAASHYGEARNTKMSILSSKWMPVKTNRLCLKN